MIQQPFQTTHTSVPKTFMAQVFSWMFTAIAISGLAAWLFSHEPALQSLLLDPITGITLFGKIVMFLPIGFVLIHSFIIQKGNFSLNVAVFLLYSLSIGMSLSFIFYIYSIGSIITVFLSSAALFGTMAIVGYTTQTDLTRFGSLLKMALIGIFVSIIINLFMKSSGFSYLLDVLIVIIFTGLTAYDMQKIKEIGLQVDSGSQMAARLSLNAALNLYLDFINIFLSLLRLFGKSGE